MDKKTTKNFLSCRAAEDNGIVSNIRDILVGYVKLTKLLVANDDRLGTEFCPSNKAYNGNARTYIDRAHALAYGQNDITDTPEKRMVYSIVYGWSQYVRGFQLPSFNLVWDSDWANPFKMLKSAASDLCFLVVNIEYILNTALRRKTMHKGTFMHYNDVWPLYEKLNNVNTIFSNCYQAAYRKDIANNIAGAHYTCGYDGEIPECVGETPYANIWASLDLMLGQGSFSEAFDYSQIATRPFNVLDAFFVHETDVYHRFFYDHSVNLNGETNVPDYEDDIERIWHLAITTANYCWWYLATIVVYLNVFGRVDLSTFTETCAESEDFIELYGNLWRACEPSTSLDSLFLAALQPRLSVIREARLQRKGKK